jgi:hypothetical protein
MKKEQNKPENAKTRTDITTEQGRNYFIFLSQTFNDLIENVQRQFTE